MQDTTIFSMVQDQNIGELHKKKVMNVEIAHWLHILC